LLARPLSLYTNQKNLGVVGREERPHVERFCMLDSKEKWWVKMILGILGIVFGILFVVAPVLPWFILTVVVGVFLILMGFAFLGGSLIGGASGSDRGRGIVGGILAVFLGILVLVFPGITDLFIIMLLGFFLIFIGIMEMSGVNPRLKQGAGTLAPQNKGLLMFTGIMDLIIGIIFVLMPLVGGVVVAWLAGLLLMALGMSYVYMSLTSRSKASKA